MLNYNNGISVIGQTLQDFYQLVYICKMKSGCRLIQNINGISGTSPAQFCRQFDPLRFSSG